MIEGWDDESAPLSQEELDLAELIASKIASNVGEGSAVTSRKIIQYIAEHTGIHLSDSRLRKIINYIRLHRLVSNLVATSKGYYVEKDPVLISKYIQSLKNRANAIMAVAESYK